MNALASSCALPSSPGARHSARDDAQRAEAAPTWEEFFAALRDFQLTHGHMRVTEDECPAELVAWVETQRARARTGDISRTEYARLTALELEWEPRDPVWEGWLDGLRGFRRSHGHCKVPQPYPPDPSLSEWARQVREQYHQGCLSAERVRVLRQWQFDWGRSPSARDASWGQRFAQLVEFHREHGHTRVTAGCTQDAAFAPWVQHQRTCKRQGKLSAERIQRLEGLGFVWEPSEDGADPNNLYLESMLARLEHFRAEHGHTEVPPTYAPDPQLGQWVQSQRAKKNCGKMSAQRCARLEAAGFVWYSMGVARAHRWQEHFAKLMAFRERFGHCRVANGWVEDQGLSEWMRNLRVFKAKGTLPPEREAQLEAIGFEWHAPRWSGGSKAKHWDFMHRHLAAFRAAQGHTEVPRSYAEPHGFWKWVHCQRVLMRRGALSADRRAKLEALDFAPTHTRRSNAERWERHYLQLLAFRDRHGHCRVPKGYREDAAFGQWVANERGRQRRGQLSAERIARLEACGIEWWE